MLDVAYRHPVRECCLGRTLSCGDDLDSCASAVALAGGNIRSGAVIVAGLAAGPARSPCPAWAAPSSASAIAQPPHPRRRAHGPWAALTAYQPRILSTRLEPCSATRLDLWCGRGAKDSEAGTHTRLP